VPRDHVASSTFGAEQDFFMALVPRYPLSRVALAAVLSLFLAGEARAQNTQPQVTVAVPLSSRVAQWDEFTGRFEAIERVEVRPRVSGYIDQVNFRDGTTVQQGDLLFTIDQRPFQLAVDSAKADVARTQAQIVLNEADYQRAQELVKTAATPVSTLDQRRANLDISRAQEMASEAALHTAQLNGPRCARRSAAAYRTGVSIRATWSPVGKTEPPC
jgi:membrane fusion protein, multidrug efflux system